MAVMEQLTSDMKAAMKAKEKEKLTTVRMLISAIKTAQIDFKGEMGDEDMIAVLTKEAKKRKDASSQYRDGGRDELADKEDRELEIIEAYLPEQLSEEAIAEIVDEVIASTGASSKADMGKVMGPVMGRVKGLADGNTVKKVVMSKLG